jgi:hypothetical protein
MSSTEETNKKYNIPFIALSALILSMITAYYQFFWSKQSLQISLIDLSINHDKKTLLLKTAIVNDGTEPVLVKGYRLGVYAKEYQVLAYLGGWEEKPFVIEKGDIVLKEDSVSLSQVELINLTNKSCSKHDLALNIETLTNAGETFFNLTHIASIKNTREQSVIRTRHELINVLNNNDSFDEILLSSKNTREAVTVQMDAEPLKGCQLF